MRWLQQRPSGARAQPEMVLYHVVHPWHLALAHTIPCHSILPRAKPERVHCTAHCIPETCCIFCEQSKTRRNSYVELATEIAIRLFLCTAVLCACAPRCIEVHSPGSPCVPMMSCAFPRRVCCTLHTLHCTVCCSVLLHCRLRAQLRAALCCTIQYRIIRYHGGCYRRQNRVCRFSFIRAFAVAA